MTPSKYDSFLKEYEAAFGPIPPMTWREQLREWLFLIGAIVGTIVVGAGLLVWWIADRASLAFVATVFVGLFWAWFAVDSVIVRPILRELRQQRRRLERIEQLLKSGDRPT